MVAGVGYFFFSSRRRHTSCLSDWSSDVCSSDLGELVDIAAATTTTLESDLTNNRTTFITTVEAVADVAIVKEGPEGVVITGTSVTYTVTVRNNGPSAAANVVVKDTLPAGATFVSASNGGTLSGNVVTWPTIATLAAGASQTFTLVVTAPSTAITFTNTSAVTSTTRDPNPGNNHASVTITPTLPRADISVVKTGPITIGANEQISYQLTVSNAGPQAADNVVLTDTLPAGVTFVSATGNGTLAGNVVTWPTIATLGVGENVSFTLVVTPPAAGGAVTDIAAVTTTTLDPNLTNNRTPFTTTVEPVADVAIAKDGPESVITGTNVTYTLRVTNNGPSAAANVVVKDTLPAGATFVS